MRPYQLGIDGRWLDLDTVQAVHPPRVYIGHTEREPGGPMIGCAHIVLRLKHSFTDRDSEISFHTRWPDEIAHPERIAFETYEQHNLRLDIARTQFMLAELKKFEAEVYEPFLAAWKGRP